LKSEDSRKTKKWNQNSVWDWNVVLHRVFLSWFAWNLHLVPNRLTFFVKFGKVKNVDTV
jgi:hypothetical protein